MAAIPVRFDPPFCTSLLEGDFEVNLPASYRHGGRLLSPELMDVDYVAYELDLGRLIKISQWLWIVAQPK